MHWLGMMSQDEAPFDPSSISIISKLKGAIHYI